MAGVILVAVVDDHPATAEGLAALLGAESGIEVVGTAASVAAARELIAATRPDVVLCDVELAGGERGFALLGSTVDGAAGIRPAVVFLSSYDYPAFLAVALERGSAGYLLKTAPLAEIVAAIHSASTGGSAFTAGALCTAQGARRRPSERELAVIELVATGRSNDEIAAALAIGPKTVESHLRRLFGRYELASRTELVVRALREGWISIGR